MAQKNNVKSPKTDRQFNQMVKAAQRFSIRGYDMDRSSKSFGGYIYYTSRGKVTIMPVKW